MRAVVAVAVAAMGVLGAAGVARADDGLTMASDTTYEYVPDAVVVRVTAEVTVQNVTTDRRQGNVINRIYYDGVSMAVPLNALNVAAASNGAQLTVDLSPLNDDFARAVVRFPNLFSGQRRTITVTFDLPGDAPRTKSFVRVNPAYASFAAFGEGDPGQVTVRIVVPVGFDVETLGNDVSSAVVGDKHVYTAEAIAEPNQWYVGVSARNDAALDVKELDIGGRALKISSWPGDAEWTAFVEKNLTDGLPALEKLIGQPWPITARLSIVEASTPYLRGYAGWFLPLENKIEVGEELDDRTLLHELSHAWFNRDLFTARWMDEGLAEEVSARAMAALGEELPAPEPVDEASPNAVELESWAAPRSRTSDDDSETWGYNASFSVMRALTDEIGMDGMARAIDGAANDKAAYHVGTGEPAKVAGGDDWRRFLDLLEEAGGSTKATELFRRYVVTDEQQQELDERAAARTSFAALRDAGGEWLVPAGVVDAMNAWRFARAAPMVEAATKVLETRDALATTAGSAGLTVPIGDESAYEGADTPGALEAITAHMVRQSGSIATIETARSRVAAPRNRAQRLGLKGKNPEAELQAAEAAFAADDAAGVDAATARAVALIDGAEAIGREQIRKRNQTYAIIGGSGALLLLGGGTTLGLGRRRRTRRRRAAAAAAQARAHAEAIAPLTPSWPPATADGHGPTSVDAPEPAPAAAFEPPPPAAMPPPPPPPPPPAVPPTMVAPAWHPPVAGDAPPASPSLPPPPPPPT